MLPGLAPANFRVFSAPYPAPAVRYGDIGVLLLEISVKFWPAGTLLLLWPVLGRWLRSASRYKLPVHPLEGGKHGAVAAEAQDKPPAGTDQPPRQVDQFLDHRADAAALGRMADRGELAEQSHLADGPEDVIGKSAQGHDQGVGGELAAGQPLQVEIGLELAMELLRGGVVPVQGNHLLGLHVQVGPPAFQGNIRGEQQLPMPVGSPLDHAHNPLAGINRPIDLHGLIDHQQADSLAGPGRGDRARAEHAVAPGQFVAVAWVPLDEEADVFRRGQSLPGFQRVVRRVQTNHDLLLDEHMRRLDDPLDEHHEPRLAVLAAGPQFDLQAPALHTQIGGDGRITVKVLVGAAHPFLAGVRVVLREHVHVQGHKAIGIA